jgi:hypothetical protein
MNDLVEFLLKRIAEDEADMELAASRRPFDGRARWLRECEAKRQIVSMYQIPTRELDAYDEQVLRLIAWPYVTHPDFDVRRWLPR